MVYLGKFGYPFTIAMALTMGACARGSIPAPPLSPPETGGVTLALVGGTIIDGNGGAPLPDATIVVVGDRIAKIGPRATTVIPKEARQIDVSGKYLTPGFIDANVHISNDPLNAARKFLMHGVTTLRDTHGELSPLLIARDSLASGAAVGSRLLVASRIIGLQDDSQIKMGTAMTGIGHQLTKQDADSLRTLTAHYIDKGLDFIKIAVTDHDSPNPQPLLVSLEALKVMVAAAHQKGKFVDSHTNTAEGVQMAALGGIDVLQHPEALRDQTGAVPMPSDVAHLLGSRPIICAIFAGRRMYNVEGSWGDSTEKRQLQENVKTLIQNGCLVAVATDATDTEDQQTIWDIESLVALGMTPTQALTAATRTGAIAAQAEHEYGTLEVGKRADILVLRANPLADIHNIEKIELVFHHGYAIDQSGKLLRDTSASVSRR